MLHKCMVHTCGEGNEFGVSHRVFGIPVSLCPHHLYQLNVHPRAVELGEKKRRLSQKIDLLCCVRVRTLVALEFCVERGEALLGEVEAVEAEARGFLDSFLRGEGD